MVQISMCIYISLLEHSRSSHRHNVYQILLLRLQTIITEEAQRLYDNYNLFVVVYGCILICILYGVIVSIFKWTLI